MLKFILKRLGLGFIIFAVMFLALFFFPDFVFNIMVVILVLVVSYFLGEAILGRGDR